MVEAVFIVISCLVAVYLATNVVSQAIRLYVMGLPLFPEGEPTSESFPARVACLGREVAVGTLLRLLWPLGLLPEPPLRPVQPGKVAVMLIHGYRMNRTAMYPLGWWLRRKGWDVMFFDWSGSGLGLSSLARALAEKLERLQAIGGPAQVDLVCHSSGGLIARYFIEHLAGEGRVRRLVTLGTPHQGSRMALFARGVVAGDLLPESAFVAQLKESLARAPVERYTCLAGEMDSLVFPPSGAILDGAGSGQILPGLGHLTLLAHGEVFQRVRASLSAEVIPAAPEAQ